MYFPLNTLKCPYSWETQWHRHKTPVRDLIQPYLPCRAQCDGGAVRGKAGHCPGTQAGRPCHPRTAGYATTILWEPSWNLGFHTGDHNDMSRNPLRGAHTISLLGALQLGYSGTPWDQTTCHTTWNESAGEGKKHKQNSGWWESVVLTKVGMAIV